MVKITDRNLETRGRTRWLPGTSHRATGNTVLPCTDGVIHSYAHPLIAVFCDPIHGRYARNGDARMVEVEVADDDVASDGLKCWHRGEVRCLREITKPVLTPVQRVHVAISVALDALPDAPWATAYRRWATAWLDGTDRTHEAARAASHAARPWAASGG